MADDGLNLAKAYVEIIPSAQGIKGKLQSALGGEADAAGKSAGSALGSALGSAAKLAAGAVVAGTGALATFGASAVKAGSEFDVSMSQVAATMGLTVDEIGELRDFAQEMGSTTAFSAKESADALNYMALAGYDAETSMSMLPNVLNLAAAGGIDLASASDMVTDAQTALGLSLDETTVMVDQMAKASSKSNTSVAQLGEAILTVGGNAKNLSGGTTELSTVLGIMADNGIKGAEAGTHLRNIMLSMTPKSEAAAAAFEQLGINAYDAAGELRPMNEVFGKFSEAVAEMSTEERTNVIGAIFNKTDLAAVNALIDTSADRWDELSLAIDDAAGAAEQMKNTQLDNLQGDVTLFKSALEGAKIAVSDGLTPTLREFVSFGSEGLSTLTEAFREGGLTGAMDALGGLLADGLSMLLEKTPEFIGAGLELVKSFGGAMIDNAPLLIDTAIQIIMMIVNEFISPDSITSFIDSAFKIIDALARGLIDAIPDLIKQIPTIVKSFIQGMLDHLPELISLGIELLVTIGAGLIAAIPDLIGMIPEIATSIIDAFEEIDWSEIGKQIIEGLKSGLSGTVDSVKSTIANVGSKITGFFKNTFGIQSPSKLFRDEVGMMLGLGLAEGIEESTGAVRDAMSELSGAASMEISPASLQYNASFAGAQDRTIMSNESVVTTILQATAMIISAMNNQQQSWSIDGMTFARGFKPYLDQIGDYSGDIMVEGV